MLKISVISRVRSTSEFLIFSRHEMKYFWYLMNKSKCSFFFAVKGKNLTFFPSHFSIILLGSAHKVGIILGVNIVCT